MAEIEPLDSPNQPAHVPRRFGVGVLLILMTALAVLFAFLSYLHSYPAFFIVAAGTICAIAIAQILMFDGKRPRMASMIVGTITISVMSGISFEYMLLQDDRLPTTELLLASAYVVGCTIAFGCVLGVPIAYMTGILVSGVFLIVDRYFGKERGGNPRIELRPMTEADLDSLQDWLYDKTLALAWSRGVCAAFPTRESLRRFLDFPLPANADRLCFKAIAFYPTETEVADFDENEVNLENDAPIPTAQTEFTERIVGYIELVKIDRLRKHAVIERAIVYPDAPQRSLVSLSLLIALVEEAFGPLKLEHLAMAIPRKQLLTCECAVQLRKRFPKIALLERTGDLAVFMHL